MTPELSDALSTLIYTVTGMLGVGFIFVIFWLVNKD